MQKQFFSLRKYKIGLVSVAIGLLFLAGGASQVQADQIISAQPTVSNSQELTVTETAAVVEVFVQKTETPSQPAAPEVNSPTTEINAPTENVSTAIPVEASTITAANPAQTEPVQPLNKDSNDLIQVPQTWEAGYKGQGRLIAIIDSGIDVNHDVLHITDPSKAKYSSQEQLEAAKAAAGISYGKWYNNKVVFAYDYFDGSNNIKELDEHSHGMHVTGIAAGNPSQPDNGGNFIHGVAPEAQVLFMRVFSDRVPGTQTAFYAKAIEDAVKLGADSINLSLGAGGGSLVNSDPLMLEAIKKARKAGVSVVMAAGNDGTFGNGVANPRADQPDYGVVGSPSTARDGISVASFNNSTHTSEAATIIVPEGQPPLKQLKTTFTTGGDQVFDANKIYDYVYANLGTEEDFANLDLTGKIALIKRGEISFNEKIVRAISKGAIGAVIFNNKTEGDSLQMSLEESAKTIPSAFFPMAIGEELAKGHYQIKFDKSTITLPNPEAGRLSDFTSWGLSSDGELKPDLAAPGGSIYSSINNGKYASMNGTSMASPHVAGVVALVKEYLIKTYPNQTAEEQEKLIKHLLMSTAVPHFNQETQAYTSPRQQGAGLVNTLAAISTGLYLTGEDDYSSISLGNVSDQFQLTLTVHNISDQDRQLSYITDLNTDGVADGRFTLKPRKLTEIPGKIITVKAHSSQTLTIDVDASTYADELSALMKNGYFLEGFVRFLDPADQGHVISIPFTGFRGQFQNLAVLEKPIYNYTEVGDHPFYHEIPEDLSLSAADHFTALLTNHTNIDYEAGKVTEGDPIILGSSDNEDGLFTLNYNSEGKVTLAISPNKDGNQDLVLLRGVFLRNFDNLVATIYKADDTNRNQPLWQSSAISDVKNFYGGNPNRPKSTPLLTTAWEGQDQNGQDLPDGHYNYVVTYYPMVPGAHQQEISFDLILDRQAPSITTAHYDAEKRQFLARPSLDAGDSGILRQQVFYFQDSTISDENGKEETVHHKVLVPQNQDGSFTLPVDIELSNFYYAIEDQAGNRDYKRLEDLIKIGNNKGLVSVRTLSHETHQSIDINAVYIIKDAQGRVIEDIDKTQSSFALPFGDYTIELITYDKDHARLLGSTTQVLHLTEDKSWQFVDFLARSIDYTAVTLDLDKVLPRGSELALVDQEGNRFVLPAQKYSPTDYGKNIPLGHYTISANLPDGLEFLQEELSLDLVAGKNTSKQLTILDKRALKTALSSQAEMTSLARYYNASIAAQEAYQAAYQVAQHILNSKQPQAQIDTALTTLTQAANQLTGQETDWTALLQALEGTEAILASSRYYNADKVEQLAYDTILRSLSLTLADQHSPQSTVNAALANLLAAQEALNGRDTDLSHLQQEIIAYENVKASNVYRYARAEKQAAYDQSIQAAQALPANSKQSLVNQAVQAILDSKAALDGHEGQIRRKTEEHRVMYRIIERINPDLEIGKRRTVQRGIRGMRRDVIEISPRGRKIISSEIYQQPVDRIVEIGGKLPEVKVRHKTEKHHVMYRIIERVNPNLPVGTRRTIQRGIRGMRQDQIEITAAGRRIISSTLITPAIDRIVEVGGMPTSSNP